MNQYPVEQMYKAIKDEQAEIAKNAGGSSRRIRASEAGNCLRNIWYRLSGYRAAPRTCTSVMLGVGGDADHDVARQMLKHYGIEVRQVTYNDDGTVDENMQGTMTVNASGEDIIFSCRADGEVDTPEGVALLEIKGMTFWKYKKLADAVKAGPDAVLATLHKHFKRYVYQAEIGMRMFHYERCHFVFKDRSMCELMEYCYSRDDKVWTRIVGDMAEVWAAVREGEPPAPILSGSSDCKWCPYHYLCHGATSRKRRKLEPHVLYPEREE